MKKLKKIWQWIDDRTGISEFVVPLAKHPVPPNAGWLYVFGSATLICFAIQVITGITLAFLYQPSTNNAYDSLQYITHQVPLGRILRGMHWFGASGMILFAGIHMVRVFLMGVFKYPREMSWLTGSFLLLFTVSMGFTGQVLRWDGYGVWSLVVGAEQAGRVPFIGKAIARMMLGGYTLGGETISHIFAFHVFWIPAILFLLIGVHLYMVIRNGISEPPVQGRIVNKKTYRQWYNNLLKEKGVPFWPNAAWHDMAFGIFVVLAIIAFAFIFGPKELAKPPSPVEIQTNPHPDWYLLWIYAMYALLPRNIESVIIWLFPLLIGVVLLLLPFVFNTGERHPVRRPLSIVVIIIIALSLGIFWHYAQVAPWSPRYYAKPLSASVIGDVSPSAKKGGDLFYTKRCIFCHTISGDGGIRGPDLTKVDNRLNHYQMTIRIVNGAENMPAFGPILTKQELNDLLSFLETRYVEAKSK